MRACSAAGLVLTLSRSPNEWHEGMQRSWLGAHAFMRELIISEGMQRSWLGSLRQGASLMAASLQ